MAYTKIWRTGYLIRSLYLSPNMSDITLVVNGQRLSAHKHVLCERSQYFQTLFFGEFAEKYSTEVELKDIDTQAFKALLKFCYYEELAPEDWHSNDISFAIKVFKIANYFQTHALKKLAQKKIIGLISVHNVMDVYDLAELYESKRLLAFVKLFTKKCGQELRVNRRFLNCRSVPAVKFFIKSIRFDTQFERIQTLVQIIDNNKNWVFRQFKDCVEIDSLTTEDLDQLFTGHTIDPITFGELALRKCKQMDSEITELKAGMVYTSGADSD